MCTTAFQRVPAHLSPTLTPHLSFPFADDLLFDVPDLSDLDPSGHGGFKVLFAREVPLEMRLQTTDAAPAEAGALEAVLCKVCVREGDNGRPSAVKVELSSEGDLFFHFTHVRLFMAGRSFAREYAKTAPVSARIWLAFAPKLLAKSCHLPNRFSFPPSRLSLTRI